MALLPRALERELINALLSLPSMEDVQRRDLLLVGLPQGLRMTIRRSHNARLDLLSIVQSVGNWGTDAMWQFLDNARDQARGSVAAESLEVLRSRLEPGGEIQGPYLVPALPPQGIFGRDHELDQIVQLLRLDEGELNVPPLALRGMGGIGKTTLAIALAHRPDVLRFFPDGVLWSALGPDPDIRLLLNDWGRALEVDLQHERDEKAASERLRSLLYSRRMLIVVDDVWEIMQGSYFMVGGPLCRILITTRSSLVAQAVATRERTFSVDLLSPAAGLALLERLSPEAVRTDRESARLLCSRLEFLPLALNLAGRLLAAEADVPSRMRRLIAELSEQRKARLNLIQEESRPGISEETGVSIRAILAMSVQRLNANDQDRFAMLGTFGGDPPTWDIQAARAVWECSIEEAEATISRLIQHGLVEPTAGDRYRMHALLADYAVDLMEERGL